MPDDDNSGDWFERNKPLPAGDKRCRLCGNFAWLRRRLGAKWGKTCEACQGDLTRKIQREGKLDEHEMRQGDAGQN